MALTNLFVLDSSNSLQCICVKLIKCHNSMICLPSPIPFYLFDTTKTFPTFCPSPLTHTHSLCSLNIYSICNKEILLRFPVFFSCLVFLLLKSNSLNGVVKIPWRWRDTFKDILLNLWHLPCGKWSRYAFT